MTFLLRDRLLPWILAPVVAAAIAAWALSGATADAVRAAAVAALPIAIATALIAAATFNGSTGRVLAGVLASTLVRLLGVLAAALILCFGLGHPAAPTVLTLGGCVVAGLVIETAARWRQVIQVKEPTRG